MSAVSLDRAFLPLGGIHRALSLAATTGGRLTSTQLCKDLASVRTTPLETIENSVALMIELGLLELDGELIRTYTEALDSEELKTVIARRLVDWLGAEGTLSQLADALQYNPVDGTIAISPIRLPWSCKNLNTLLLEAGVFARDHISSMYWSVPSTFAGEFLEAAKVRNEQRYLKGGRSLEQLKDSLDSQEERGEQAEEWVLSYEIARLAGHPLMDQVRRVSEEAVGAGYDITSFSSKGVLEHDQFIEVKSYAGDERFYWSATQIEVAKDLGEKYHLYLVDMKKITRNDYCPGIISGPYTYFIESDQEDWDSSIEKRLFVRRNANEGA